MRTLDLCGTLVRFSLSQRISSPSSQYWSAEVCPAGCCADLIQPDASPEEAEHERMVADFRSMATQKRLAASDLRVSAVAVTVIVLAPYQIRTYAGIRSATPH